MWIPVKILLCAGLLATTFAAKNATRTIAKKSQRDERGKRNLEYSISHDHFGNFKANRRITLGVPQYPRYPFVLPLPNPYVNVKKSSPPYVSLMEPLVHYSQRDPLYNPNTLSLVNDNDQKDEEAKDQTVGGSHLYGTPYVQHAPIKHVIERPVYIKEPEPIIEIIIRESNVTLPPEPHVPVTLPPKKKEQVQVFYVKYKKNPNGYGKDSVIYDKPIPALTPHVPDEPEEEEPVTLAYPIPLATAPPPPSTTLRAIIKPDSETYEGDKIHVTFGQKLTNENYKRSHAGSGDTKGAPDEPEPSISQPQQPQPHLAQGRQIQQPQFSGRVPLLLNHNIEGNYQRFNLDPQRIPQLEPQRVPQPYRPFTGLKPQGGFRQFAPRPHVSFNTLPQQQQQQQQPQLQHLNTPQHPSRPAPPQFPQNNIQFPQPAPFRQPVPYQPFDQLRPQEPFPAGAPEQIHFPRPHTHFPIQQHLPQVQKQKPFNPVRNEEHQQHHQHFQATQQQFQDNLKNEEFLRQQSNFGQQSPVNPRPHFQPQQQPHPQHFAQHPTKQFPQQQQQQQHDLQQFHQQQQLQQVSDINYQNLPQLGGAQDFRLSPFSPIQRPQHQQQQHQPPNILPPGGELIQSVPKYEQHISVNVPSEPTQQLGEKPQQQQNQPQQQQNQPQQQQQQQQFNNHQLSNQQELDSHFNQQQQQQQQQFQYQQQQFQQQQEQFQRQQFQQQQQFQPSQPHPQNHQLNFQQFQTHLPLPSQQQIQQLPLQQSQTQFREQTIVEKPIKSVDPNQPNSPQSGNPPANHNIFVPTPNPPLSRIASTSPPPAPTTTTPKPQQSNVETTTKDAKELNIQLPDEVPDELRQQLLSSGILNNADISVLDYDKVGDIPLSALPPDQLANFYNAGGGQQLAGSEPVPAVVDQKGASVAEAEDMEASETDEVKVPPPSPVEMKVVKYDPETEKGQQVKDAYVKDDATHVAPVVVNDDSYTRYLPLKLNGAQFPLPDVPELKGRNITSVVVLAPVNYSFTSPRVTRDTSTVAKQSIRKEAAAALDIVIKDPTLDNFMMWLDKEKMIATDKQAVVLLVTGVGMPADKEIFMYDIANRSVSRLSGELSSAFVEAAETNAVQQPPASENIDGFGNSASELGVPPLRRSDSE